MSFPRYDSYRDSGVEWLGEVPEHWGISRLGFESWVRARLGWKGLKAEEYVEDGFVFLATPNIKGVNIDFENVNFINQYRYDESPEIKLRVGDVLLAKDGSTLGTVNVVRYLPRPATVNSSIAVITPHKALNGFFLYYLFQSSYMDSTIQRIKGGMGVPHLFQEDLNKFYTPLPSLLEQQSITAFLDRETAKIDALIAEQQRLIELLKEKRQAVISHAVTKGLNPDAPLKDSGIEWLGEVLAHWEVKRIKNLSSVISKGTTPTSIGADFTSDGIRFLKAENITEIEVSDQPEFYISEEAHATLSRSALQEGDVLVVIAGATTGKAAVLDARLLPANTNQAVSFIRPKDKRLSNYINCWLNTNMVRRTVLLNSVQSAQPNLSMEDLGNIPLPLPPFAELIGIATFLDRETDKLDTLTAEAQTAITLLQERRTALISAAVTGKIDVRGLVENHPDVEAAA
ncbi:restriction endonuclease subunit S [Methyloterricola oryzae]|uniref:restriction endonuclease subunit S n=1 Tax=Methyloterricola oryzae TaxID=1495050 RepID=UPI0009E440A4|nr:restriction endonuclease subunit S [Methyloterricola oryzae]